MLTSKVWTRKYKSFFRHYSTFFTKFNHTASFNLILYFRHRYYTHNIY